MARFFRRDISRFLHSGCSLYLGLFWCCGLLFGYFIYLYICPSFSSMMRGIVPDSVSIVGLLCVSVFPFLISAFVVYISKPSLLFVFSFCKAFLIILISLSIIGAFPVFGPLFRCLILFHDLVSTPILYWYWHRHISGDTAFSWSEVLFLLSCFLLIGSFVYHFVSPFSVEFIKLQKG